MANEVEKLNGIAIASIEAINGKTDANIEAFNSFEFAGFTYDGITWSSSNIDTDTHRGGHGGTGNLDAFLIAGGYL